MMPDNKPVTIYEPTVWKDHIVEKPRTYTMVENEDGTVTQFPSEGEVMQQGTPMNAANLNKLESGLKKATEEMEEFVSNGTAANSTLLGGKKPEYYLPRENLLDNSYFLNPVNQRGKTAYTGSGYSIDRWRAYHADTVHTVTADGVTVSTTSGTNPNLYQIIPEGKLDPNKVYTAAACDSSGQVYLWSGKPTANTTVYVTLYLYNDNVLFRLNGTKTWVWAALYEGAYTTETLPEYQPKGYARELAECMRYYYQSWDGNTPSVYGCLLRQAFATSRLTNVELPIEMRIVPTIIIYSTQNEPGKVRDYLSSGKIASGMSAVYANTKSFIPGSNVLELEANTVYALHYAASADL